MKNKKGQASKKILFKIKWKGTETLGELRAHEILGKKDLMNYMIEKLFEKENNLPPTP